jgi:transcription termination factor Rho
MSPIEAIEFLLQKIEHSKTNEEFFKSMNSWVLWKTVFFGDFVVS